MAFYSSCFQKYSSIIQKCKIKEAEPINDNEGWFW